MKILLQGSAKKAPVSKKPPRITCGPSQGAPQNKLRAVLKYTVATFETICRQNFGLIIHYGQSQCKLRPSLGRTGTCLKKKQNKGLLASGQMAAVLRTISGRSQANPRLITEQTAADLWKNRVWGRLRLVSEQPPVVGAQTQFLSGTLGVVGHTTLRHCQHTCET